MDNFWSNKVATKSGIDSDEFEPVDDCGSDGDGVSDSSLPWYVVWGRSDGNVVVVDDDVDGGGGDEDDEAVAGAGTDTFDDWLPALLRLRGWYCKRKKQTQFCFDR